MTVLLLQLLAVLMKFLTAWLLRWLIQVLLRGDGYELENAKTTNTTNEGMQVALGIFIVCLLEGVL